MAEYRGTVKGRRSGSTSRLGDPGSGLRVTADTWDAGIRVLIERHKDGHDIATVFVTGGSNNPDRMRPVYQVDLTEEAVTNNPD